MTSLSDWDITKYLNIWVTHRIETPNGTLTEGGGFGANLASLTQGFSGVYVSYRIVGCDPDGNLGYTLTNKYGKILSHEVGHYLGLHHTFEGGSCSENDCGSEGDFVCDTEPHDNSISNPQSTDCDLYGECGTREPIENIMNYAGQTCGNTFTQGQKDRMKSMVTLHFQGLVNKGQCGNSTTNLKVRQKTIEVIINPNPVKDVLYLSGYNGNYTIVDMQGRVIQSSNCTNGVIFLTGISNGSYVLKAAHFVKKFIVQNSQ